MISDKIVLKETRPAESSVSSLNFEENIVVIVAMGALLEIANDTSTEPLKPAAHNPPIVSNGKIISLRAIETQAL